MWDVPARWDPAGPHETAFRVDVFSSGGFVTSTTDIHDGDVTEQWVSGVRARLNLTVDSSPQWLQWLELPNLELGIHSGVRWGNDEFLCPLGVFPVDPQPVSLPAANISISAQDRWSLIVLDDFTYVQSSMAYAWPKTGATVRDAVAAMIDQTNLSAATQVFSTRLDALPNVMLQKTRDATIKEFVESIGAEVFVDRLGYPVIRDRASQPGRAVRDGEGGSLVRITKSPSLSDAINRIGVSSSSTDVVFPPVFLAITDPNHPANSRRIRKRALRYSSPLITSEEQARVAARTVLDQRAAAAMSWSLECFPDASRMPGDVMSVTSDFGTVTGVVTEVRHSLSGGNQTVSLGAV